jgi:hypothetical protein
MKEQKDFDGLTRILRGDNKPLIRQLAAKALGEIGDPGDERIIRALQDCLEDYPLVAAWVRSALDQLEPDAQLEKVEKPIIRPGERGGFCRNIAIGLGLMTLVGFVVIFAGNLGLDSGYSSLIALGSVVVILVIISFLAGRKKKSSSEGLETYLEDIELEKILSQPAISVASTEVKKYATLSEGLRMTGFKPVIVEKFDEVILQHPDFVEPYANEIQSLIDASSNLKTSGALGASMLKATLIAIMTNIITDATGVMPDLQYLLDS